MYSDYAPRRRRLLFWAILLLLLVLLLFLFIRMDPGRDLSESSAQAIRDAVRRGALQCYAVEGVYPPDLQYLEDNYGLQINTEVFYVTYEAFASNLPPTIRVTRR